MRKTMGIIAALTLAVTGMASVPAMADGNTSVVTTSIGSEPDNLNPWLSSASDTEAIFHNVFEGLVLFDSTGAIIPGLAESWEISDDGLTYTFHLRDDVTFHNGKDFTSADVVYTYEALSGLNGSDPLSSKFTTVVSVEAPDDVTVVITIAEADNAFLQLTRVSILPEGYDDQETSPVGTGPYKFVSYTPGQEIILKRNEEYYDEERAGKIDEADIYIMTDDSAVLTALQSGQLDFATVYADNAEYLSGDFTIESAPQNMVQLFALNNAVEPFDNVLVRQAINYAVDREKIVDGVFAGYATEIYSNFSPVMAEYYNDELADVYSYDPEKAMELLAEAGYADGFSFSITVPSNYQKHVDTAQVIVEDLKAVGINAELKLVDWATWLEDVYRGFNYETTIIGLTGKLDPQEILYRYTTGFSRNFYNFSDPAFDALLEEAKTADEETSVKNYKEAQQILTEEAAAVYLTDPHAVVVTRSDLKGYTFYPVSFVDLAALYFED